MNNNRILKWGLFTFLLAILILLICSNSGIYNVNNKFVVEYIGPYNESMTSKDKMIDLVQDFFNERDSLNKDINTHLLEDLISQDKYVTGRQSAERTLRCAILRDSVPLMSMAKIIGCSDGGIRSGTDLE